MDERDASQSRFADRLRQARQRRGWTQTHLAIASGVSRATVARAELSYFEPRQESVRRLAATLGIRLAWLLTGEGAMEPMEPERSQR